MKILTGLFLAFASVSIAQAKVYKCPGEVEGKYTYQQKPCEKGSPDANQLEIREVEEAKIEAEKERFAKALEAHKAKKSEHQQKNSPEKAPTEIKKPSDSRPPEKSQEKKSRGRWTDRH